MLRRLLGPALFLSVGAFSGHARADDAQALFDEGLGDMKAGRYKLGCALIKRSLDVDAHPGTLFTLAECYSRAGKFASSVSLYDRFLAGYGTMPPDQREQQAARAELSRTERTRLVALVSWLTVRLPDPAPSSVVVTLDGEEFAPGMFGVATAVDPGAHVFTTRTPDGPLIEQRVDITPGERKTALLEVRNAAAPSPPAPTQEDVPPGTADQQPPARTVSPWVYVTGGVGAAGLVTGAVSGVVLLQKRKTILANCGSKDATTGAHVCTAAGKAAADSAQNTWAPITTVALGLGVAGAVTAIVLLVTDGPSGRASSGRSLVPLVGAEAGGGSVTLLGTW